MYEWARRRRNELTEQGMKPCHAWLICSFLPPGVQKGDKFDLEVQTPSRSDTTSLRGGWLMETRMTEMAVLGGQIHEGHPWATGEGAVLVDPSANGEKDRALLVRGRVLGG